MNFNSDKHARICNLKINPFGGVFRMSSFLFITLFSVNVIADTCSVNQVMDATKLTQDACNSSFTDRIDQLFCPSGFVRCPDGGFWSNDYACHMPATCGGSSEKCWVTITDSTAEGTIQIADSTIPYASLCDDQHLEADPTRGCKWKCVANNLACNSIKTNAPSYTVYGKTFMATEQQGTAIFSQPQGTDGHKNYNFYNTNNCFYRVYDHPYGHCHSGVVRLNAKSKSEGNVIVGFTVMYETDDATYTCETCKSGYKLENGECTTCKEHFRLDANNNCVCDTGYKLENGSDDDPGNDECVIDTGADYEDSTGQFNLGTNNCTANWWQQQN